MINLTAETRKLSELKAGFSEEALIALQQNSYPGSVRELEHIVERPLLQANGRVILPEHLQFEQQSVQTGRGSKP